MISKKRIEESRQLLRKHLVTLHDDGDENSLYVRFSEIMHHIEDQDMRIQSWELCAQVILDHSNDNEGTD